MNTRLHLNGPRFVFVLLWLAMAPLLTRATDGTFTYQGRLTSAGSPANGAYDLVFALYDAASGGVPLASAATNQNVTVANGTFTVMLDFGANVFDGSLRWLQITIRSNASPEIFETLTPRQPVTAVPCALHAGTSDIALTARTVVPGSIGTAALQSNSITAEKIVSGQLVRSLNSLTDEVMLSAGDNVTLTTIGNTVQIASPTWSLNGNSGTTSLTQFLGTTDDQPFEIRVNSTRALRIEPNTIGSAVNIIGGCKENFVLPGVSAATIGGGGANFGPGLAYTNSISSQFATISGGVANLINVGASSATIAGGLSNRVGNLVTEGVIAGGSLNTILDNAFRSTIGGGWQHTIAEECYHSTIAGGWQNSIADHSSTIGGGIEHSVGAGARFATIAGGAGNVIQEGAFTGTIAGGGQNLIGLDSYRCSIGGGKYNQIGTNSPHAMISGGVTNTILDNAEAAAIPGGAYNTVGGAYGFAAGRRAAAIYPGTFVWADSTDATFDSAATNEFAVRATGGVRMITGVDAAGLPITGATIAAGSGSWSSLSDRNAKENFGPVDPEEILAKVAALPLQTWNYKTQGNAARHLGPVAQDFHAAFRLGENDTTIPTVDAEGVALAAIQGLNQKLDAELKRKEAEIQDLRRSIAELKHFVAEMAPRTEPGQSVSSP